GLRQPLDDLFDRADRPVLAVALQHILRRAAKASSDAPRGLHELALVAADDDRRHQRVAEGVRIPARALTGLVQQLLALAGLVNRPQQDVVLVGETRSGICGAGLCTAAHED